MLQAKTLNFRLGLSRKADSIIDCAGNYFIELTGENSFNLDRSFSETFYYNSEKKPFITLMDVAEFSTEMAAYWQFQLLNNPKLGITGVEELADVWKLFSIQFFPLDLTMPREAVYHF